MEPEGSLPNSQQPATCPYPEPDQSSLCPHPTSLRSILISSPILRLDLSSGLFPSGLPTKTLYAPLLSPKRATCPTHLSLLGLVTQMIFGEKYRAQRSFLCSLLHSCITSSLLGPNILLSTLFSKPLSLHSSLDVNDQRSQPYKISGKIIVLYILIVTFWATN